MDDLMQRQIHESCKLALPEGLKDLMSDISREVIRAQPRDIYKFIANYLQSLLEVRETFAIACRICKDTFTCACQPDIYKELRSLGLNEEDAEKAVDIIQEYFKKDTVKEQSLFLKLIRKINIEDNQVEALKNAVRRAFNRYHLGNANIDETNGDKNENVAQSELGSAQYEVADEMISPMYRSNQKTSSSTSLAGSLSQCSDSATRFAMLSKISEEHDPSDFTNANNDAEKSLPGVTVSFHINIGQREYSDKSVEMDVILDSRRTKQLKDDEQQDDESSDDEGIIYEDIKDETDSDSSSIDETLQSNSRGSLE